MGYTLGELKKLSVEKLKEIASSVVIDTPVDDLPTRAEIIDVLLRHVI